MGYWNRVAMRFGKNTRYASLYSARRVDFLRPRVNAAAQAAHPVEAVP